MNIQPLSDKVIIRPLAPKEKTESGIFIPDTAKEKSQRGTVVSVGPGKWDTGIFIGPALKEGDEVLFAKHSGVEIKMDDGPVLLMRETDIWAKI